MTETLLMRAPTWSGLLALGRSPVMKLTMLTPFIGSLILFNAQLMDLLRIAPVAIFGLSTEPSLPLWRLAVTFFGLLALGSASFFFQLFCPPDLKGIENLAQFAARETSLHTDARASDLAMDVLDNFRKNRRPFEDSEDAKESWRPAYPERHEKHFYLFANRIAAGIFTEASDYPSQDPDADIAIFDNKGDVNVDQFADRFITCTGAARNLPIMLGGAANEFPMELYTLRYDDLDYSYVGWRALIAGLYGLGFALLALPTGATIIAVCRALI